MRQARETAPTPQWDGAPPGRITKKYGRLVRVIMTQ